MAGAGVKVFSSGEILTAAQVNQYLMDQVVCRFADAATRDASFGGAGQPLLTEGRICYLDSSNLIQYYDGSTWVDSAQFTIGDGTITTAKLAANSVTSDKIAPGTVIAADIAAGTITATELADGAVTSGKILDGTIVNGDINASAAIADTKLATISTADKVSISAINIDGGTDIGAALVDADLIIVDDGAGGTNRKAAFSRVSDFVFNKVSGDATVTSGGSLTIANNAITQAKIADRAVGSAELDNLTLNAQSGTTYTLALTDAHKLVTFSASASTTLTIPTNSSVAFDIGDQVNILQLGAGQITISGAGVTIRSEGSKTKTRGQYALATLIKIGTDEWVLIGNLTV